MFDELRGNNDDTSNQSNDKLDKLKDNDESVSYKNDKIVEHESDSNIDVDSRSDSDLDSNAGFDELLCRMLTEQPNSLKGWVT